MTHTAEPLLIQAGTVVDGTGASAIRADVRLRDGKIAEVGARLALAADEAVFDASGCSVAPGFIESHTHFDGAMWWQPELDPLPGYGVTTTIMGNCGFALAPISADAEVRREIVKIFSFFEDIPEPPFLANLPWDWRRWSEYRASMERDVRVPINYGAFAGHIALRLTVMGMDAWTRAATLAEIAQMVELLDDALAAGALGLSSNLFDHDGENRPVPSLRADDAELEALIGVLARYPNTILQVIVDLFRNMTCVESLERLARLCEGTAVRVQWGGLPTFQFQKDMGLQAPLLELHEKFAREGRDFWTAFAHVPPTVTLSIQQSLIYAQSNEYVWHEFVVAETQEQKLALLRDPEWRARARHSWDNESFEFSPFRNGRALWLENSENGIGPLELSVGDYADQIGVEHPSDAMAEWLIANGLASTVNLPRYDTDDEMILRLLRDPYALGNVSDAGAHGQMLCGAGENVLLLTEFARDRGDITLEEAVHVQTGKAARHFGLGDRGVIAEGKRADIAIFALDEIETREKRKVYDVPDGAGGHTWRWTRDPAPMRLTLVNGIATFRDGKATGARPGSFVSPNR